MDASAEKMACTKCNRLFYDLIESSQGSVCGNCWEISGVLGTDYSVKALFLSIMISALVDYTITDPEKIDLKHSARLWADEMEGSFDLCATAKDCEPRVLRAMMLWKMDKMDKGEELKSFRN